MRIYGNYLIDQLYMQLIKKPKKIIESYNLLYG